MELDLPSALAEVRRLVVEFRQRCLWSLCPDDQPETVEEALRVFEAIEAHGDAAAFRRTGAPRQWPLFRFLPEPLRLMADSRVRRSENDGAGAATRKGEVPRP